MEGPPGPRTACSGLRHALDRVRRAFPSGCHPPLVTPVPPQTLSLRNDPGELPRLVAFIDAFFVRLSADGPTLNAFQVALEEIAINVINHGYRDGGDHVFTVALAADAGGVTAVVTDDAPAFDPLDRPPVDIDAPLEDRPIGGLGIHLVKKLMTGVRYERRDGRNILTLTRDLRPHSP